MSAFETKLENAAWHSSPSWAVIATEGKAFNQRMLFWMAKRVGADITEVEASQAVYLTQPWAIADVIDEAARTVSSSSN